MKKNITKAQIVDTTLEFMRDKNDLRVLNLREIARLMGCAHTNLYNYFGSYTDLLWEAHAALGEKFISMLGARLLEVDTAEQKLRLFFAAFVEIYMKNRGWFRLAWLEYIGAQRPEKDRVATETTVAALHRMIVDIWQTEYCVTPEEEKVNQALHTVHCYIIGEISNYIAGRALIQNETALQGHVADEAARLLTLYLCGR